jgi:hypothetical protein
MIIMRLVSDEVLRGKAKDEEETFESQMALISQKLSGLNCCFEVQLLRYFGAAGRQLIYLSDLKAIWL